MTNNYREKDWIKEFNKFVEEAKNETGEGWHFRFKASTHPTHIIGFIASLIHQVERDTRKEEIKKFKKIVNTEPSAFIVRIKEAFERYEIQREARQTFREFILGLLMKEKG